MAPHEILVYYRSRQDEIVDAICQIVDIESPSHDAERSRKVADWIERAIQQDGADTAVQRVAVEDGDHILIKAFAGDGPTTMLLGHTDTVHPVGSSIKNPTRIEGDRIYGCGIFDMKANIVLMLEAFRFFAVKESRPAGPVSVLLSCDEEVGSFTGRTLVEQEARLADRCLVLEPSADGKVKTGRKGTGMYTLRAHGVPAHAGLEPEKGANAILELSRHIEEIQSLSVPRLGTTVNVTTFNGGTTSNVIPDLAECQIDVRFSTMDEGDRVDQSLRAIETSDDRTSLQLEGGINRPPLERTFGVVDLFNKARDIAAQFDYELDETQVGGASDGNFVGALGVPVLDGLGIKGAGAHTLEEYILLSDIVPRATLLTVIMARH